MPWLEESSENAVTAAGLDELVVAVRLLLERHEAGDPLDADAREALRQALERYYLLR